MGTETSRREKIGWMERAVADVKASKRKLTPELEKLMLATFALKNFSTVETGKEILGLLKTTGKI